MLQRKILKILVLASVGLLIVAQDAPAWPRWRHRRCVCLPPVQAESIRPAIPINPLALRFLTIMEDSTESGVVRAQAASQLAKVADASCVDRLTALLPGDWDAISMNIVAILGQIGDRRALPVLEKMRQDESVNMPGKINATLDWAIDKL